jgi:hypothetical protein
MFWELPTKMVQNTITHKLQKPENELTMDFFAAAETVTSKAL